MREILSFIFDMATDPLTLPIEPWKEWIILGVIGLSPMQRRSASSEICMIPAISPEEP